MSNGWPAKWQVRESNPRRRAFHREKPRQTRPCQEDAWAAAASMQPAAGAQAK